MGGEPLDIFCAAKLNLYLQVDSIDENNYHPIKTIYQSIDLFDQLTIRIEKDNSLTNQIDMEIDLDSLYLDLSLDQNNLIYRAIELYLDETKETGNQITITVKKDIPIAGGLAGGSSNAAGCLYALNNYFFDGLLTQDRLLQLAMQLGADVPFCLLGGRMLGTGYGEQLMRLPDGAPLGMVIIYPPSHISLKASTIYNEFDKLDNIENNRHYEEDHFEKFTSQLLSNRLSIIKKNTRNDLESAIINQSYWVEENLSLLRSHGYHAMVSGSGPTIFSIVENEHDGERLLGFLEEHDLKALYHNTIETPFQVYK